MPNKQYDTIEYYIVCHKYNCGECMVNFTSRLDCTKREIKRQFNNIDSNRYNCSLFRYIRNNGELDDFTIKKIQFYSSSNKKKTLIRLIELRNIFDSKLTFTDLPIEVDGDLLIKCRHGIFISKNNIICNYCKNICLHDLNKYKCIICNNKQD